MKPEEALRNIGDWISEETRKRKYDKLTVIELSDSLVTLKEVIEKQVPKKPIKDGNKILCPACNLLIAYNKNISQYCWTCGQNIEGCV